MGGEGREEEEDKDQAACCLTEQQSRRREKRGIRGVTEEELTCYVFSVCRPHQISLSCSSSSSNRLLPAAVSLHPL